MTIEIDKAYYLPGNATAFLHYTIEPQKGAVLFSPDDRKNVIASSLVILLLMIGGVFAVRWYKSLVPEHVDQNTINISLADYDQAITRWDSAGAISYQMTVRRDPDEVTLLVDIDGNVQVLRHTHKGEPVPDGQVPAGAEDLRRMTAEDLFGMASDALDAINSRDASQKAGSAVESFYDYDIQFDAKFGYPTHIVEYERTVRPSREISWRKRLGAPLDVKDFKVLR